MVRLRVLFAVVLATGLMGLGVGIEIGQRSRAIEKATIPSMPPVCSVDSSVRLCETLEPTRSRWRTIRVPPFKIEYVQPHLAGDIESELTDAVVKAIESKTPYKVVTASDADQELTGTIVDFCCRCPPDYPRAGSEIRSPELHLVVKVSWKDMLTGESLLPQKDGSSTATVELSSEAYYRPEIGEVIEKPRKESIERMAEQIVSLMDPLP